MAKLVTVTLANGIGYFEYTQISCTEFITGIYYIEVTAYG